MNNRNDLTHLYPKISDRTDNMNHREKFRNISRDNFEKDTNVYRYFPTVAALITVPVTLFVMLVNLLKEDLNSGSYDLLMPVLVTGVGFWIFLSIIFFGLITKRLQKIGVENSLFLVIYSLSGLPLSQFIYNIHRHLDGNVDFLLYTLSLFFMNILVTTAIMLAMKTDKISTKTKYILFVAVAVFCLLSAFANNR